MLPSDLPDRQCVVDKRQSAIRTPHRSLKLGEQPVKVWQAKFIALGHVGIQALAEPDRTRLRIQ